MSVPPGFGLSGRRALVVGAGSGIGRGAALALAAAGAHVTLAGRGVARLAETAAQIAADGGRAETLALDIADIAATEAALAGREPFDILLNAAGMARHSPATETTEADFDAVVGVNLKGAYFLTRAVAAGLIAAGRKGSLINISSQMGHVGGVERAVYCASKFAVEGFTRAMAIEFGPHDIRVNTICPTFIRTPLTEPSFADPVRRAWIEERIKLPRVGQVEDVAGAVLYLASDASRLMTGSALMLDGGWTAD